MKFWVGVTDNSWFDFLARRGLDEANFWQPSAKPPFLNAPIGMPFLFKLKRPRNHIAGGGFFVTYSTLPIDLAWEIFGEKNGAASIDDLRVMLEPLISNHTHHYEIGCTVLANPVFLNEEDWIINLCRFCLIAQISNQIPIGSNGILQIGFRPKREEWQ